MSLYYTVYGNDTKVVTYMYINDIIFISIEHRPQAMFPRADSAIFILQLFMVQKCKIVQKATKLAQCPLMTIVLVQNNYT